MSIENLSKDEFLAHIGYVREDIGQVNKRLDELNGRTRAAENRLTALESRDGGTHGKSIAAGSVAGGFVVGIIEAIRAYFK